jgi:hypothetical protein
MSMPHIAKLNIQKSHATFEYSALDKLLVTGKRLRFPVTKSFIRTTAH